MKAGSKALFGGLAVTLAVVFTTPAQQQSPYLADYSASGTQIRAGFTPPKTNLVLGQPLQAIFTVENLGPTNFTFLFGCDYRSTGRHNNFIITATNSAGVEMPDPVTSRSQIGGGLGSELNLKTGEGFTNIIDLSKFRVINKPGVYTFNCSYGLGGNDEDNHRQYDPIAHSTFVLTILERTPENVETDSPGVKPRQ